MINQNFYKYMKVHKQIKELYKDNICKVSKEYSLSLIEAEFILFIANNPGYNSAKHAVDIRGFSKSNLSKAVEGLLSKNIIYVIKDEKDARFKNVFIREESYKIVKRLQYVQKEFILNINKGFTSEDKVNIKILMDKLVNIINQNFEKANRGDK